MLIIPVFELAALFTHKGASVSRVIS
jgi:hypothetical protein